MQRYALFFTLENFTNGVRDLLYRYTDAALNRWHCCDDCSVCRGQPFALASDPLQVCLLMPGTQKEQAGWTSFYRSGVAAAVERVIAQAGIGQEAVPSDGIADCLDFLTTVLPKQGAFVEVFWLSDEEPYPDINDKLSLFGSLRQLIEKHQSLVSMVTSRTDCVDADPWLHILRGQKLQPEMLCHEQQNIVWQGNMILRDSQFAVPLLLPGFILCYDSPGQPAISIQMEQMNFKVTKEKCLPASDMHFVSHVGNTCIPALYFSPHVYTLQVQSYSKHLVQSRAFLESLEDDPSMCYIMRLCMRPVEVEPADQPVGKYRPAGKKEPVHCEDFDGTSYGCEPYHFALMHDGKASSSCKAHLLLPLSQFSAMAGHRLVELQLTTPADRDSDPQAADQVARLMEGVTHFSQAQFSCILRAVEDVQASVLKEWIDHKKSVGESLELSLSEMVGLLTAVRQEVLTSLEKAAPVSRPLCPHAAARHQLPLVNEYDLSMYTSLERAALVARTEHQQSLQINQPSASIGGLAPPVQGQVLKLDVSEFLKHFRCDGTAVSEDLQAVQTKHPNVLLCQYTQEKLQTLSEDQKEKQHDTYYNIGKLTDTIEKQCDKLKARLQAVETYSTCSYVQAGSPATMTLTVPKQPNSRQNQKPVATKRLSPGQQKQQSFLSQTRREERHNRRRQTLQKKPDGSMQNKYACKGPIDVVEDSRRLLASHKMQRSAGAARGNPGRKLTEAEQREWEARVSRSQRHKQKLEEVVSVTLESKGIEKNDAIFKACAQRLYTLVKCFVKDLATSHNLRQEMMRLAELHVGQVIDFERTRTNKS